MPTQIKHELDRTLRIRAYQFSTLLRGDSYYRIDLLISLFWKPAWESNPAIRFCRPLPGRLARELLIGHQRSSWKRILTPTLTCINL